MTSYLVEQIYRLIHTLSQQPLCVAIAAIGMTLFIRFFLKQTGTLSHKILRLRKKIYKNWKNNPGINVIRIQKEYTIYLPEQNSAEVYVKVMAHYPSKGSSNVLNKTGDPFLPPFPKGAFIDHLSDTHSLIYNGNSLLRCHSLVITKKFVEQNTPLNVEDFSASLLAMKAASGFAFFNSAPDSGSSQRHKHLQVVPYSAFRYGHIPIEDLIDLQEKIKGKLNGKTFFLPQFRFKHVFHMFPQPITSNLTDYSILTKAKDVEHTYTELLELLENVDMKIPYNLILSQRWMFIVLRKREMVKNTVKINALAFTGSFVIRNDKEFELFPSDAPFDILRDVTYPTDA